MENSLNMKNKLSIWFIVIIIVFIIIGIIYFNMQKKEENIIKIGGLFGLTGYASFAGEASKNGFIMAIEDSGMKVDYVIEDFKSDRTSVLNSAKKLTEIDNVKVVIGPEWVEFGEVIIPVAENSKILFISPWMNYELNWSRSKYYLSATPSNRGGIRKLIEYMQLQKIKTLVIIYSNNAFSISNVEIFKDEIKDKNIKLIEIKTSDDLKDYRSEILKIKQSNPDAIYSIFATDNSQGIFNKELKELNVNITVFTDFSRAESDILLNNFGNYSQGIIYSTQKKPAEFEEFRKKYIEKFKKEPAAISAATSYDITKLVLMAIKNGANNSDDIRSYLLNTKDYQGFSNKISFNEQGIMTSQDYEIRKINFTNPEVLMR